MRLLKYFNHTAMFALSTLVLSMSSAASFAAFSDVQLKDYFGGYSYRDCRAGESGCYNSGFGDSGSALQTFNGADIFYHPTDSGFSLNGSATAIHESYQQPDGNVIYGREKNISGSAGVSFTVLSATLLRLTGALVGVSQDSIRLVFGTGQTRLINIGGSQSVLFNEILTPGDYYLSIRYDPARATPTSTASYDLNANFSNSIAPVPLPAAAWMFLSALGLLVGLKRKVTA